MIDVIAVCKKIYHKAIEDSLYRNSIVLLLSSLINAGFGFFFWIICAHFYTQQQIGIATALISATGLVSGFGTLGFNNSVIRFLPISKRKDELLSTAFIIVSLAAGVAGTVFLVFLPHISHSLLLIRSNSFYMASFVIVVIAISLNIVIDNSFTAYRSTQYTLIKNGMISILKLIFVPIFLHLAGFGIFISYGLAFFLVTLSGLAILRQRFNYKPVLTVDNEILRETAKFSIANYIVSYLNGLPVLLLPILITNLLGAKVNAVYYIAYTIASLLFFIPLGVGNALFAEGSHSLANLRNTIKRAAFINSLLLIPAILIIIILAPYILDIFGKHYSGQGIAVLRILSISSIFLGISYPCGSILNVLHKLKSLMIVNAIGSVTVISLTYLFLRMGLGLIGAMWAWVIGWAIYALIYLIAVNRSLSTNISNM
jgi:O-antigen/teichoic acid export membrane protein